MLLYDAMQFFGSWQGTPENSCLFEAWLSCGGNWKTSRLYISITSKNKSKTCGVRRWLTKAELVNRFGKDVAEDIIARKMGDESLRERETRWHPELPGNEEWRQYLTLDDATETESAEEVIKNMYSCAQGSSSSSSSSKDDSSSSSTDVKADI